MVSLLEPLATAWVAVAEGAHRRDSDACNTAMASLMQAPTQDRITATTIALGVLHVHVRLQCDSQMPTLPTLQDMAHELSERLDAFLPAATPGNLAELLRAAMCYPSDVSGLSGAAGLVLLLAMIGELSRSREAIEEVFSAAAAAFAASDSGDIPMERLFAELAHVCA